MFTPEQKEAICKALWDYACRKAVDNGWYDHHPVPPTYWELLRKGQGWLVKPKERMKNVLEAMDVYLNEPIHESDFQEVLETFKPSKKYVDAFKCDTEVMERVSSILPSGILSFMFHDTWDIPAPPTPPVGTHMVVSPDKMSVSFYTDEEWVEYQKTVGK